MSKLRAWKKLWQNNWRRIVSWGCLLGATIGLFVLRLATLTPGFSRLELGYIASNNTVQGLLQTPSFLPHRAAMYALSKAGITHVVAFRSISVAIALLAVFSMFYILHRWYSTRVSLLGTLLFASSSIVLHAGRIALPDVMLLLIAPLIALGIWMQGTRKHKRALVLLIGCLCLAVYVPGFIWISITVLVWQGKRIARAFVRSPLWLKALCVVAVLTLLAPAVISCVLHPTQLLSIAGLPTQLPTVSGQIDHIRTSLAGVFWRYNGSSPALWLAGTPWFDVFTAAMLVLGVYSLRFERKLLRSKLQLGTTALFGLLVLAGGLVSFTALAPIAYLIATGGVAFMLQQWFAVFPRNPIARSLAMCLVVLAVSTSAYYNAYRYFVAWPGSADTSTAFTGTNLLK